MRWTRGTLNWALLALVAGLALLLMVPEPGQEPIPQLTRLDPAAIRSLRIQQRSGPLVALERRDDGWWMSAPHQIRAERGRCEALTRLATLPSLTRFAAQPQRLAEFGLAPPLLQVYLDGHELQFGASDPVYHHRYVKFAGSIHLIPDSLLHLLVAPAETFVSPRLLPEGTSVEMLSGPHLLVSRSPSGDWHVTGTMPEGVGPGELVQAWQRAQAQKVLPPPESTGGRSIRLRLRGRPGAIVFTQTQADPQILLREDLGLAYHMGGELRFLTPFPAQAE